MAEARRLLLTGALISLSLVVMLYLGKDLAATELVERGLERDSVPLDGEEIDLLC